MPGVGTFVEWFWLLEGSMSAQITMTENFILTNLNANLCVYTQTFTVCITDTFYILFKLGLLGKIGKGVAYSCGLRIEISWVILVRVVSETRGLYGYLQKVFTREYPAGELAMVGVSSRLVLRTHCQVVDIFKGRCHRAILSERTLTILSC